MQTEVIFGASATTNGAIGALAAGLAAVAVQAYRNRGEIEKLKQAPDLQGCSNPVCAFTECMDERFASTMPA